MRLLLQGWLCHSRSHLSSNKKPNVPANPPSALLVTRVLHSRSDEAEWQSSESLSVMQHTKQTSIKWPTCERCHLEQRITSAEVKKVDGSGFGFSLAPVLSSSLPSLPPKKPYHIRSYRNNGWASPIKAINSALCRYLNVTTTNLPFGWLALDTRT